MNVGLIRGAMAMSAGERQLDTIAANLANTSTIGYKRGTSAAHSFQVARKGRNVEGMKTRTAVDFSQGNLNRTGRNLDMALFGEGFFAIEGESGEVYTRNGAFQLTPQGVLVNSDGYQVAWDQLNGSIDPTGLPVLVDGEGNVRQGQSDVGRLRVVNFEDPSQLRMNGTGYWVAPEGTRETAHNAAVHQGALEESNATGIEEMIAMISVQRNFEMAARAFSAVEEGYRRLTRPF